MKSWLVRTFRGRQLDRNPLRRPSDRAETLIGIWLFVAFAVIAPFAARAASASAYAAAQRSRAVALATLRQTSAVTLRAAPAAANSPYALVTDAWVIARWVTPHGQLKTGRIQVHDGTPKGRTERIWVTASGDLASPPLPLSEFTRLTNLAGFGAVLGIFIVFAITGGAARHVLNRRRMAAWDAEWATTEPRWNRQRW